ncbi:MAG: GGDEF domain-containing protein [Lachnospiraceae bacterium]|nr:GGDEF domain-containing protein [Lachnospiraceae bacterium]
MKIIHFDIDACVLCVLILLTIIVHKSIRLHQNKIFLCLLGSVTLASFSSLIASVGQNGVYLGYSNTFTDPGIMYLSTFAYMLFHIACPMLFFLYVKAVLNIDSNRFSDTILSYGPLIVAYTVLVLTPINNGLFYFRAGRYYRGEYMWIFYLVAVWYSFVSLNYIMLYRANIRLSVFISLLSFVFFDGVGVVMQFLSSDMVVESFFSAVTMLVLYITIERPGDYIDSVTGLQNDYAFYVNIAIRIRRRRNSRMVVISLDNVNFLDNSIGMDSTSNLLTQAAAFFEKLSKSAVAYRLDRDLFVILIREDARLTHMQIMDAVRQRFAAPFRTDRYDIMLFDCSMYVSWPDDVKDTEELKQLITLFADKDRHRMKHVIQASSLDLDQDRRRRSIDRLLHTAISAESFNFKYQPVKSAGTGRFDSVELKPMIESPEFGMITAGEYFPIAEDNGTAVPIIKYILRVCFEYIHDCGLTGTDINEYAIPVPNAFLLMRSAASWVLETALELEVDPGFVTFEISENTMIHYNYALEENIRALHKAGFSFMLTDYGNGYTDAEMLIKMRLREVALNRDLLSSAPVSPKADTLVKCAVDMMKGLSIGIKAYGIDSSELESYAVSVGVDKLQGFALSRYLSGADLVRFMKERRENNGIGLLL